MDTRSVKLFVRHGKFDLRNNLSDAFGNLFHSDKLAQLVIAVFLGFDNVEHTRHIVGRNNLVVNRIAVDLFL